MASLPQSSVDVLVNIERALAMATMQGKVVRRIFISPYAWTLLGNTVYCEHAPARMAALRIHDIEVEQHPRCEGIWLAHEV